MFETYLDQMVLAGNLAYLLGTQPSTKTAEGRDRARFKARAGVRAKISIALGEDGDKKLF